MPNRQSCFYLVGGLGVFNSFLNAAVLVADRLTGDLCGCSISARDLLGNYFVMRSKLFSTGSTAFVVTYLFALAKIMVNAAVTHHPRIAESAIAWDGVVLDNLVRSAGWHVLYCNFFDTQLSCGDDDADAAFGG
jgi:hypothetical protein